jgi:NAD(P)H-flavin reductase
MLFKGPIPKFKYEANSFDRGLCIAGGSGITPMWQLITHSLDLPEDKTKWTLVFSNVTDKDICKCSSAIQADVQCCAKNGTTWPPRTQTG